MTKSARATRCQSCKKAGQLLANALMAASGGLAARKTQPDDQPTEIPTETDDTRTAGGEEGAQEVLG